jgi:DNA-binding MarR family transcriptional regulator
MPKGNEKKAEKQAPGASAPGIAKEWPTLLLIKLGRITVHRFTEALEPYGIRPRHFAALIELRDSGTISQQTLCGQLRIDPTNVVAILNELERNGYAERRRDPDDRRRHMVEITKKGLAVIDKCAEAMDGVEEELLTGFGKSERETFVRVLTEMWESTGGYEAYAKAAIEEEVVGTAA